MSEKTELEDIDAPIELKQSKIAANFTRVGVSKRGLQVGALVATAAIGMIAVGIMNAGPGGNSGSGLGDDSNTEMAGQTLAPKIGALKPVNAESPSPDDPQHLTVRGNGDQPATAVGGGPNAQAQQSPAEQHKLWLEKKRYERIEGRILAADLALTADIAKGQAGMGMGGAGMRPAADTDADPVARIANMRAAAQNAIGNPAAGTPQYPQPGMAPAAMQMAAGTDPNVAAQMRNKEFLKEAAEAGYLPETVRSRMGQHELSAGSIIPALMLTGINSDLPGVITAQVRQTVYDTFDEGVRIIPQGARVVGRYSSQVASGQERVLVAWDELIMPNGNRINLRGMSGADGLGQAGFGDQVNTHFWRTWSSSLLVSLLGVGVQLSQPQNSSYNTSPTTAQQAAGAAANSLNQVGSKALDKNLNLSPTLVIRPGYAFNIIVNKSVVFPAYKD